MATVSYSPEDIENTLVPIPLTSEILEKAKLARKDQGIHETEVSFCGEAGLHESLITCDKNPNHVGFTPIKKLGTAELPGKLNDPDVVAFLISKARETVRLTVSYTSPARPPGYCFSNFVGVSGMTRVGSGRVWSVYEDRVRYDIPCPFSNCSEQGIVPESLNQEEDDLCLRPPKLGTLNNQNEDVEKGDVRQCPIYKSNTDFDEDSVSKTGNDSGCSCGLTGGVSCEKPNQTEKDINETFHASSGRSDDNNLIKNVSTLGLKDQLNDHIKVNDVELSSTFGRSTEQNGESKQNEGGSNTEGASNQTDPVAEDKITEPIPIQQPLTHIHTNHYVTGYFRIHTAKHVVFDTSEAQHTAIEFFYDDPDDVRHVIRARGVQVTRSDEDGDYCVMDCVSHDPRLGKLLDAVRREWSALWPSVKDKMYGEDVAMVVSHPHGCSKQFSIGQCLNREWQQSPDGQGWYRYTYSAATCPGSSGAPVWIPGRDGLFSGYAPHSGSPGPGQAQSAVWFFWKQQ